MRVLLLNPPFLPRYSRSHRLPAVAKSGNLFYPHWLALAGAVLDQRGHTIELFDCPAEGVELPFLLKLAARFDPGLIVMDSSTPSWYTDCETAQALRETLHHCRICMTGNHATFFWRQTFERAPAVDHVALGEYEETVADLADAIDKGGDINAIPGLASRAHLQSGRPLLRPLNDNLDRLPMVSPIYQRFLEPELYTFNLSAHPFVQIMAGRGCPASCFFCSYPQISQGTPYRHRTAENIVNEMNWIKKNMPQIKQVNFEDDNFGADRAFARRLGEVARVSKVDLPFFANISASLDPGSLESLKAAGLHICSVGFDTIRYSLLEKMGKLQTEKSIHDFMAATRRLGILVHGCFMVGFPGESRGSMRELYNWACRIRPDSAQFYPVMPYPGTGAWHFYNDKGCLATTSFRDWLTRAGWPRCVLNLPGLTLHEIDEFCDRAFVRFHLRPRYLAQKLWQALNNPREGLRSIRAALLFARYLRNKREQRPAPLPAQKMGVTETWRMMPVIPAGRMQLIERHSQAHSPDTGHPDQQR